MKKYLLAIATFMWIAFIFMNSLQTGVESGEVSSKITEVVIKVLNLININLDFNTTAIFIRKCAHVFEYFILGILFALTYINMIGNVNYRIIYTFLSALVVSISDEIIQLYVPGRVGAVTDVLIDTIGIVLGIILILLIIKIRKKRTEV